MKIFYKSLFYEVLVPILCISVSWTLATHLVFSSYVFCLQKFAKKQGDHKQSTGERKGKWRKHVENCSWLGFLSHLVTSSEAASHICGTTSKGLGYPHNFLPHMAFCKAIRHKGGSTGHTWQLWLYEKVYTEFIIRKGKHFQAPFFHVLVGFYLSLPFPLHSKRLQLASYR